MPQAGEKRQVDRKTLLDARGIHKRYGRKIVLEDANVAVRAGEAVALIGENGAGKPTLLRICAGLLAPDAGTVRVDGKVGYCPQDPGVLDLLTAEEHLAYFGTAVGPGRRAAIGEGHRLLAAFRFGAGR